MSHDTNKESKQAGICQSFSVPSIHTIRYIASFASLYIDILFNTTYCVLTDYGRWTLLYSYCIVVDMSLQTVAFKSLQGPKP